MKLNQTQKKALAFASSFLKEADLEFSGNQLRIRAMDEAHVSLVDMTLAAQNGEKPVEPVRIRVNVGKLVRAVSLGKEPSLEIDNGKAVVRYPEGYVASFRHLEPSEEEYPEPKIAYGRGHKMRFSQLRKVEKFLGKPETVAFVAASAGQITAIARTEFEDIEIPLANGLNVTEFKSAFGWPLVEPLTGLGEVTAYFLSGFPMKVEAEGPGAKLTYYAAPKIEADIPDATGRAPTVAVSGEGEGFEQEEKEEEGEAEDEGEKPEEAPAEAAIPA